MLDYKYNTQLLIEGIILDEDKIKEYFYTQFKGTSLLVCIDTDLIKIHFHTNEPWQMLKYCSTLGEIFDIIIEDMERKTKSLQG